MDDLDEEIGIPVFPGVFPYEEESKGSDSKEEVSAEPVKMVKIASRVTQEEWEPMNRKARLMGVSMSEYVRRALIEDSDKNSYPILPTERYELYMELAAIRRWLETQEIETKRESRDFLLWAAIERLGEDFRKLQAMVIGTPIREVEPEADLAGEAVILTENEAAEFEMELDSEGGS